MGAAARAETSGGLRASRPDVVGGPYLLVGTGRRDVGARAVAAPGQWKMKSFPQGSLALLRSRYFRRYELVEPVGAVARLSVMLLSRRVARRLHAEPGRRHLRTSARRDGCDGRVQTGRAQVSAIPASMLVAAEASGGRSEACGSVIVHTLNSVQPAVQRCRSGTSCPIEQPAARWTRNPLAHVPV